MPLADEDARFLKAKADKVFELPAGLKLHYAPRLVQQAWREWVHSGRQVMPDIREVAAQDEDSRNDIWTWDLIVRYVTDSTAEKLKDAGDL